MNTTSTMYASASNPGTPSTNENIPNRTSRRTGLLNARKMQKYINKGYSARKVARLMEFINIDEGERIVKQYLDL